MSQYLKQTAHNSDQERLWHLTALWLCNLAHNNTPLPEDYASLLAQLGQAIESIKQHVSTNSHPDALLLDNNTQALIEMVYVELLALAEIDDQTRAILNRPLIDSSFSILSFVATELETVIFNLDDPQIVISLLRRISLQLDRSHQTSYAMQARTIADDTEHSLSVEAGYDHQQGEIEQQLQELYSAIYRTIDDDNQIEDTAPEAVIETQELTSRSSIDDVSHMDDALNSSDSIRADDLIVDDTTVALARKTSGVDDFNDKDQMSDIDTDIDIDIDTDTNTDSKIESVDVNEEAHSAYVEKCIEVINDLEDFLPIWQQDPQDLTALTEIQRGFYVLRSLSLMVDASSIGEMTGSIENLLNHLLKNTQEVQDEVVALVTQAVTRLPEMVSGLMIIKTLMSTSPL